MAAYAWSLGQVHAWEIQKRSMPQDREPGNICVVPNIIWADNQVLLSFFDSDHERVGPRNYFDVQKTSIFSNT